MLPWFSMNQLASYPLSARENERHKTPEEKQTENAYVFGHMLTCMLSDPVTGPIAASLTQKLISGEAHLTEHVYGEGFGDVGAYFLTLALQRNLPEVTAAVRTVVEPLYRPLYQWAADRQTNAWAEQEGIPRDSEAFTAKKKAALDYEMRNIPLQATWTLSSIALNVFGQKAFFGNERDWREIAFSVSVGAAFTLLLQNGARILAPESVHTVDRVISEHVVKPVHQLISHITSFGQVTLTERQRV
jgi:hypothetical protein